MLTTKNIVLTKETIALAKERCRGRIDLIKNLGHEAFPDFTAEGLLDVIAICDSHEALRARVETLEQENDRYVKRITLIRSALVDSALRSDLSRLSAIGSLVAELTPEDLARTAQLAKQFGWDVEE